MRHELFSCEPQVSSHARVQRQRKNVQSRSKQRPWPHHRDSDAAGSGSSKARVETTNDVCSSHSSSGNLMHQPAFARQAVGTTAAAPWLHVQAPAAQPKDERRCGGIDRKWQAQSESQRRSPSALEGATGSALRRHNKQHPQHVRDTGKAAGQATGKRQQGERMLCCRVSKAREVVATSTHAVEVVKLEGRQSRAVPSTRGERPLRTWCRRCPRAQGTEREVVTRWCMKGHTWVQGGNC